MLRHFAALLLVPSLCVAADFKMTADERAKTLKLLDDSQKEFLESVSNLSEAQWSYRAAPERWSIAQVAEHIMLAEDGIYSVVQKAMAAPADPDAEAKTGKKAAMLERILLDRSGKAKAPEQLQPQSKLTRDEIVQHFKTSRAKTIEFAKTTDLDLKSHVFPNPFFGPLNAYDWLIYIPLHQLRHDQQIAEVKADPSYPK